MAYDPHDPRSGGMVTAPTTTGVNSTGQTSTVQHGGIVGTVPTAAHPTPTAPGAVTPPAAATGTGGTSAPTGPTDDMKTALGHIQAALSLYGLPASLADWAWSELVAGSVEDQVMLDLQQRPEFKQAFPEIQAQLDKGLTPMSPGAIVNYRTDAMQRMREAGLPQGFWDSPADFANLITNEVSTNELQQRIELAKQATYNMPQEVRDHLARDYGITDGHLAAQFLDPGQAEPLLAKQFLASQIGGAADRTGFGATTIAQNEQLATLGIDQAGAQKGFNELAGMRQLMNSLPGENTTGISVDDQLASEFAGNADAQRRITTRADQRRAQFAGGGGYTSGQGGYSGVGSAQGA